jgi:tetratricopeptide (TPR) repeat protein
MPFVADDLGAWLVALLADAGRKKLTKLVLGTDQERALRSAATAAVWLTARELRPDGDERAEELAMVVSEVFGEPVSEVLPGGQETVLTALQAGIAGQLAPLGNTELTGTGQSSSDVLKVPVAVLTEMLTAQLLRQIVLVGTRGGPLFPLASQLNADVTHLQIRRVEGAVDRRADEVLEALARLDTAHAAAAAPVALAQLPPVVAGFTGRDDELAVLAGLLDPGGLAGPVVVSAVAGLAGVGKTTLAVAAGHAARRRGWFGGGVLFIDLHGYDEAPVEPAQALDALLRALGVPTEHIPPGVEERAGLYRSVLAQVSEPVLVIADNASSEAQVRPLLPGENPHKVLVTSRHTLAGLDARLVDVTVLDDETSVDLLERALRAGRPEDDRITADAGAAGRLARMCGWLPLALQITAALLKADPALSVGELTGELSNEKDRLAALRYDDGSGYGGSSVAAAFELSCRRLDTTSARVFRLLPVNPGPDISTAAAGVLADLPVTRVRRVLADLARAHLAEAAPGAPGRWRMHDLLRLYAQRLSEVQADADGREQARDRLLGYYLSTTRAADDHLRSLPEVAVPGKFTDRDSALAWLDAERVSLVAAVAMAADTGRDQTAMGLPNLLGEYFAFRRRFDDWLTATTISLDAARRLGDRTGEGAALNNLGISLQRGRRFQEAITAGQEAAASHREAGDRHREAMALGNLGLALQEARRFGEAITAHQESLAIFRETGDRDGEGMALNNLGIVLQETRRFEEAITAHQKAMAIFSEIGDCHGESSALGGLGTALQETGRLKEAIVIHQETVALYQQNGDRYGEASALNNLGTALQRARRFGEAITAHQEAAAIYRETSDRHGEGNALTNLGTALQEARRFDEAITAHQEAVAAYRDTGDRHGKGGAFTNLGMALRELRRFGEAITAHQEAAAIYRETSDRHGEGNALTNLGTALQEARRFDEAITAHQEAVAAYRDTGDRHGEGAALNNLGIALQEARRFGEAITRQQEAAAIYREIGDQHGRGSALNNLGAALLQTGRLGEAITVLQDAAAIYRDNGDRHDQGNALNNLGAALRQAGRFGEAITVLQDAAAIYRDTRDRHSEAMALNNVGLALAEVRRFGEAIPAYRDAVAIFCETGDRCREGSALAGLGRALNEAGRSREAMTAYEGAIAIYRETGDQHLEGITRKNLQRAQARAAQEP